LRDGSKHSAGDSTTAVGGAKTPGEADHAHSVWGSKKRWRGMAHPSPPSSSSSSSSSDDDDDDDDDDLA